MRRSTLGPAALFVGLGIFSLARTASAQPYPWPAEQAPPPAPRVVAVENPDGGVPPPAPQAGPNEYIPDGDYDPDIDGYTVEREVVYDNTVADSYDDGYDPNAYVQFQEALSPYGEWVMDQSYGYIWSPSVSVVGMDFFPYASGGHWVLSDFGWTWVSDWDWGWAPFHYGRWVTVVGRGWCWVPGTHWGPAWVAWRSGGGYVGYAPLPPRGGRLPPPVGPRSPWRFVVAGNLAARHPAFLPAHVVPSVFSRTAVISNTRAISVGTGTVRVNFGPTGIAPAGAGVGISTPVSLRTYAPATLPRPSIAPRPGLSMTQRPWATYGAGPHVTSSRPIYGVGPSTSIPIGTRPYAPSPSVPSYARPLPASPGPSVMPPRPQPAYNAPVYTRPAYAPPAYAPSRAAPTYAPSPAPSYAPSRPVYSPPAYSPRPYAPSYSAPTYAPAPRPAPSYSAPTYHAPAPVYHAPAPSHSFSPAPSYSRPSPPPAASHPTPSRSAPAFIRR